MLRYIPPLLIALLVCLTLGVWETLAYGFVIAPFAACLGFWPGSDCCPGGCPIFSDSFTRADSTNVGSDWSELLGDWSIASNKLSVATTGAIIKCNTAAGSLNNYQVRANWTTGTGKARVFVNLTDDSNWHCAEFDGSYVRIFECVGGVETMLTEVPNASGMPQVCVDSNNFLIADIGVATAIWQITPTSPYVGLGTGDTVPAAITFDDFSLETPGVGICPNCPGCGGCTLHQEMQVDLASTSSACASPCDIDGTYILPIYGMTSPVAVAHGGVGSCHWLLPVSDCSGGVTGILVSSRVTTSLAWRVEILEDNDLNVNPYSVFNVGSPGDCSSNPSPSGEVLTVLLCSGPTATLTAL